MTDRRRDIIRAILHIIQSAAEYALIAIILVSMLIAVYALWDIKFVATQADPAQYEKYKPKALEKLKEKKTEESKKIISENTDLLKTYASGYSILKDGVDYSKSDAKYAGNDLLLFSEMFNVDLSDGVDDNERTRIKEGIASTRKNFVKRLKDEGKSDAEIKEFFENDTGIFVNKVLSNEAAENIVNIAVAYSQAQQNIDLLNNTKNAVDLEANLKTIYGDNFDDVLLREEMNLDLEASKTPDLGHTAPGKQLEATGAYGVENITKEKLMGVAKAEFLGTNKAGRPEGPVDLAYMNYHDGGAQKGNFGMGNTQKYLENIGLGSEKFTLINTTTKKTYTIQINKKSSSPAPLLITFFTFSIVKLVL